jgi:putative tryptophan/tyrosine transport system substrate-binding protein
MSETVGNAFFRLFFQSLRQSGYIEGRNLIVQRYSGEGHTARYAQLAEEVVRSDPDVIFALTGRMMRHLKNATNAIPIVGIGNDPVALGIGASLARPGGNVTGVVAGVGQVMDKRLEFLREVVPGASRVGFIAPRGIWEDFEGRALRDAAQRLGVLLVDASLGESINEMEYLRAFSVLRRELADGLIVHDAAENFTHRRLLVALAEQDRLPAIYPYREFVELGGLMAYAVDIGALYRHAAGQIDRILKGDHPGEIPFYQATTFSFVVNLKTATALGLTIPPTLLARADEVIE